MSFPGSSPYRMCIVVVVALLPGMRVGGVEMAPGWEQLKLKSTTIGDTQVYYEESLGPVLPVIEREFTQFQRSREEVAEILGRKGAIIAEINRILGAVDADRDKQARMFAELAGMFSEMKLTLYLVTRPTIKDFLRAGGQLPNFTYDRQGDVASYNPGIKAERGEKPPEFYELCIPVPSEGDIDGFISAFFKGPTQFIVGGMVDVAIHEITELTMLRRAKPTDPYWRWFSDGFANAITVALVEKHVGSEAAQEFAAAYELDKCRDLEREVNLAYWMLGNFCVYVSRTPVKQESRILHARYAYAMFEAQRLIDKHGMDCVRKILDEMAARESRKGSDLLAVIRELTGEDMASRLARYQTFATKEEGIPKYTQAYQAVLSKRDWEAMFVNVMRLMELHGDVFSRNYLQSFGNAALFLFKMGHEAAGDAAMRQAIDLYTQSPIEHGRDVALEGFIRYALQCNNPGKAQKEAAELLQKDPQHPPSLAVKMFATLAGGDLAGAKALAERIQSRDKEQSYPYKLAASVLAIDPNQPNTYNRAP